jgi:hypothetical protein
MTTNYPVHVIRHTSLRTVTPLAHGYWSVTALDELGLIMFYPIRAPPSSAHWEGGLELQHMVLTWVDIIPKGRG